MASSARYDNSDSAKKIVRADNPIAIISRWMLRSSNIRRCWENGEYERGCPQTGDWDLTLHFPPSALLAIKP
ncbi:hypothetical protein GCM10023155_37120 [Bremerella cremea]